MNLPHLTYVRLNQLQVVQKNETASSSICDLMLKLIIFSKAATLTANEATSFTIRVATSLNASESASFTFNWLPQLPW